MGRAQLSLPQESGRPRPASRQAPPPNRGPRTALSLAHDGRQPQRHHQLIPLLGAIPRVRGPRGGRSRHRPERVLANRRYDQGKYRRLLGARGIRQPSPAAIRARLRTRSQRYVASARSATRTQSAACWSAPTVPRFADAELDDDTGQTRRGEQPLELTPTEFRLLRFLLRIPAGC